jgi:hypothetical protein
MLPSFSPEARRASNIMLTASPRRTAPSLAACHQRGPDSISQSKKEQGKKIFYDVGENNRRGILAG